MTRRQLLEVASGVLIVAAGTRVAAQAPAPAATPAANPAGVALIVGGEVATPLSLSLADLKAMPRASADVKDEDRMVRYEGVLVGEILQRAGVPLGERLRGGALSSYVVATASDGYRVVFSIAELDPAFTRSEIIVADSVDGKPLFAYQGPVRIVAPKDTRGARSIRMLQRLDIVKAPAK